MKIGDIVFAVEKKKCFITKVRIIDVIKAGAVIEGDARVAYRTIPLGKKVDKPFWFDDHDLCTLESEACRRIADWCLNRERHWYDLGRRGKSEGFRKNRVRWLDKMEAALQREGK